MRKPAIANFHDVRPRAIARCETVADVAEAISFADRSGLQAATRSGGHCFAGRSSTAGIVIDLSPMSSVSVSGRVATIGPGTRLGDMYDALDEHGLTIPAGNDVCFDGTPRRSQTGKGATQLTPASPANGRGRYR